MKKSSLPSAVPTRAVAGRTGTTAALSFSPEALVLFRRVRDVLAAQGVAAYLVGGVVRDALLHRPMGDIDVAVAGDSGAVAKGLADALGATVVVLDPQRQVFRVLPHEAATAYVDLAPLLGEPPSPERDALHRDFTIDAMAAPLQGLDLDTGQATLLDPMDGMRDLQARQVRAIGESVFIDDPARLLRAVRLAVELGFSIEARTATLVRRDAQRLSGVAAERVRDEFCRILAVPGACGALRMLDELGLLTVVLPELEEARGVGQPKEHYWDVLQHSLEAVGAMEQVLRLAPGDARTLAEVPWDDELARYFGEKVSGERTRALLAKIGALLHDVAKPATKTVEPNGRIRFLGHPTLGAGICERAMERLRFSNREVRMAAAMVKEHLRPGLISRGEEGPTQRAVYRYFRDAGEVSVDTLFLGFADYLAARGPLIEMQDWRQHAARLRGILVEWRRRQAEPKPVKLVDGHDLMREFHLQPGPRLRVLLEAVKESQAAGEIASPAEALALVARLLGETAAA